MGMNLKMNNPQKISVITAVKNRSEILKEGIDNWLSSGDLDEIVVVDWSSDIPFTYNHEKVKVYRVEGEKYWILTHALNLAASLASNKLIMKMDADYRLKKEIFNISPQSKNHFIRGNWELAETENDRFINGFLMIHKESFESVGGYNEDIDFYGYDDCDLYDRLKSIGMSELSVGVSSGISHKPHPRELRVNCQKNKEKILNDSPKNFNNLIELNRLKSLEKTWTNNSVSSRWQINGRVVRRIK